MPYAKEYTGWQDANRNTVTPEEGIKVYRTDKQVLFIDFGKALQIYNVIKQPFNEPANAADLPTGIRQADTEIAVEFLRGYCLACATLNDTEGQEVRLWQTSKGSPQPVMDLFRLRSRAKARTTNDKGGKVYIGLEPQNFQETIGFDEEWLDSLVDQMVASKKPKNSRRGAAPTGSSKRRTARRG